MCTTFPVASSHAGRVEDQLSTINVSTLVGTGLCVVITICSTELRGSSTAPPLENFMAPMKCSFGRAITLGDIIMTSSVCYSDIISQFQRHHLSVPVTSSYVPVDYRQSHSSSAPSNTSSKRCTVCGGAQLRHDRHRIGIIQPVHPPSKAALSAGAHRHDLGQVTEGVYKPWI